MARDQQHGVVIGDDHANPVDDVNVLDMSEPVTTVGTSAFVAASADSLMSGHDIEVGCASPSNSVAECRSEYFSIRIENMIQARREFATDLEFEVEASRIHWSELTPLNVEAANEVNLQGLKLESNDGKQVGEVDDEVGEAGGAGKTVETNMEVFQRLRKSYGIFFRLPSDPGPYAYAEMKLAEGGQAKIFSTSWSGSVNGPIARRRVLKVFKEGSLLRDLEKQWPLGMLQNKHLKHFGMHYLGHYACPLLGAALLKDGRFAICMRRCWGDLRKLIDLKMQKKHSQGPPFTSAGTTRIMLQIAFGMRELHEHDIVHRDLKAANVLLDNESAIAHKDPTGFVCQVADFECSVGVVGTRFWRAPEILQAVKSRNIKPKLFTKSADVYSYGMTCYEIVTGQLPFEDLRANDYDVVIRGERPKLPSDIKPWMRDLITRCWHPNPLERPTFKTIVDTIESKMPTDLKVLRLLLCGFNLRKLIDLKMQMKYSQGPPFTSAGTTRIMLQIAFGMRELHEHDIVHTDLKAATVLLDNESAIARKDPHGFVCQITDNGFVGQVTNFECSVEVVGTRFWRAPEILQAVKSGNIKPKLFTKSTDVYSYGMTCYEIVTGRVPFQDLAETDFDVVISGERPKLPSDIKPWMRDLITRCWHPNPLERPTFETIVDIIESKMPRDHKVLRSLLCGFDYFVNIRNFLK